MKQIYFFSLLFLCINGRAQEDTLFPNAGAYWEVKHWFGYPETIYTGYSVGISPNKMLYNDTLWYTTDYGYLLIDSPKIYFKSWAPQYNPYLAHQDTMTHLLYDFNLQVGDTAYFDASGGFPLIVMNIDTSYLLGVPRRALLLGNWGNVMDTWIQGVGSDKGLFYPWSHTFEAGSELCYFMGNYTDSLASSYTLLYDNPQICEELTVDEPVVARPCWIGLNQIHFYLESAENAKIYDLSGKLLFAEKIPANEYILSTAFLQTGLYVLQIGNTEPQKFFKH